MQLARSVFATRACVRAVCWSFLRASSSLKGPQNTEQNLGMREREKPVAQATGTDELKQLALKGLFKSALDERKKRGLLFNANVPSSKTLGYAKRRTCPTHWVEHDIVRSG